MERGNKREKAGTKNKTLGNKKTWVVNTFNRRKEATRG